MGMTSRNTRIRSYTELRMLKTFEERFRYLMLRGVVGDTTFGFDRWINQQFYTSTQWKRARRDVIARDLGCDLGIEGRDIYGKVFVHHMNPMSFDQIDEGDSSILNPEFLITVTQNTHNAIHYGDENLLPKPIVERRPGDTKLW